ncbi:MAG: hypothetical protein HYY66_02875, partial [Candidatus Tectomicrobia bacterium]|nr:hypothetical protein [Candidatus Tectomicrobia bacterium]
ISPGRRQVRYAPGIYRVLELHAFAGGVVRGVDSPAYAPRPFEVDVSRIEWE